jgi:predicted dehydrogenase
MRRFVCATMAVLFCGFAAPSFGDDAPSAPLRVGIAGLVHDHVRGFFDWNLHRSDIQIVGIAEPDQQLAARTVDRYKLDQKLLFTRLEEMLDKAHPQAVLAYTNTFDHRAVVEACARRGIPVMMEKPLAVSIEDARAVEKAAAAGKIDVLVNYETT